MIVTEYSPQGQSNKKILIIGDLIIDRTIYCTVPKISPEAPVPVAMVEPSGIIETPGGAGLAASYAVKNNIDSIFLTVVGRDRENFLIDNNIDSEQLEYGTIVNPRKTRYIDTGSNHHLLRADTDKMIDKSIFERNSFQKNFVFLFTSILADENISGIVMLDYCKGIFDNELLVQEIISISRARFIPVYIDSRSDNLNKFTGANVLKLNTKEFERAKETLRADSIGSISRKLDLDYVIVTHGKDGAELYTNEEGAPILSYKQDLSHYNGAPDVTGCGDVFDVTFCFNWCIKDISISGSISRAVDKATEFAYKPIKERLYVNTERKDTKS